MFIIHLTGEMGVLGVCSVAQPYHKNPDSFHPFSLLFSTFLLMFIATWSQDSCHSIKYHILTLNVTNKSIWQEQKSLILLLMLFVSIEKKLLAQTLQASP